VNLRPFFQPEGVVLVGATSEPGKLGYGIVENLAGFPGAVHFVGREAGVLLGRPVYARVESVPDPVDLAVLLVPAALVPDSLEACGRRGIRAVVIASGGFRETGDNGAALEAACLRVAARHEIRFLGPNCIGIIDTHVPLDTTFLRPSGAPEGPIAFLSHSGALVAAVIDWSRGRGFGFSRLVSLGNQADLTETDLLPAVAADPFTRVVTMYLEGIGDGRRFVAAAERAGCPIIVHKAGRSTAGRHAAKSHTGALAGDEVAFDAAFRRAGVLRASSTEEMLDWARTLAWAPPMRGRTVAVVTNAGGPGVVAADAVERHGLALADLADRTAAGLREFLPSVAGFENPVDMLASASPVDYSRAVEAVLRDDNVDAVMVIVAPPPRYVAKDVADAIVAVDRTKPVVVVTMGGPAVAEAREVLRSAHVPDYGFPFEAAGALGALYRRSTFVPHTPCASVRDPAVVVMPTGTGWLEQSAALKLVDGIGIPSVPTLAAITAEEALRAAGSLGYPVAVKAEVPDLVHKSRAGGVLLGLDDPAEVERGFHTLSERHSDLRGVVVQPMAHGDIEIVVGVVRDEQFGPLVMFGTGGVDIERERDVAFALAPVTCEDMEYLLATTFAGRELSETAAAAVSEAIVRLGMLAAEHPEVAEVEINPLVVQPHGVLAVDARARIDSGPGSIA
jgi:acetyl coenzyme A synthetase (ADP forming)-like protein